MAPRSPSAPRTHAPEGQVLHHDLRRTPLGLVEIAATLPGHAGMSQVGDRVYGSYGMTFLLRGEGTYRDRTHAPRRVEAGDVMLVFPEVPHLYRPLAGTVWDEAYFAFDGPAFDLLREARLLAPARPVVRPPDARGWLARLQQAVLAPTPGGDAGVALRVARFAAALAEGLAACARDAPARPDPLDRARELLRGELGAPLGPVEVAAAVGLPYETFRKRFTQAVGQSPARYRLARRLDAAAGLLRDTAMPHARIAEALGFADEFSFSKAFKAAHGVAPRAFRRSSRRA